MVVGLCLQKLAATALWQGAKLEEAPEVSGHPRELLNKIMVAVDRCIARRETAEGRKMPILDLHSKVNRPLLPTTRHSFQKREYLHFLCR